MKNLNKFNKFNKLNQFFALSILSILALSLTNCGSSTNAGGGAAALK
ncbi:MAG: hypothetical protein HAW58_02485 [Candidatus Thioglobus sp.]|nr:hypothetical protein [Candidatus Thioglobus sp.]